MVECSLLGASMNTAYSLSQRSDTTRIIGLLQMVLDHCVRFPVCLALFYHELSRLVSTLPSISPKQALLEWVHDKIAFSFQESFLCDINEFATSVTCVDVPLVPRKVFGVDEEDAEIVVNFAVNLKLNQNPELDRLLCLSPHFRLLQAYEKASHDGSLESIDALLICPLGLFDYSGLRTETLSPSQQSLVCVSIVHAMNWWAAYL